VRSIDKLRWSVPLIAAGALLTCADVGPDQAVCEPGSYRCVNDTSLRCVGDGTGYEVEQNCAKQDKICTDVGCRACFPDQTVCFGEKLLRCNGSGDGYLAQPELICDVEQGEVCDRGGCVDACELARRNRSYVGCEYWAADLDNAVVDIGAAAAQQFAVVVSNPSPLPAEVKVTVNQAAFGQPPQIAEIMELTVAPQALEVLLLPAREVDGSPEGEFDVGTGTALTAHAFKIESTVPLIAYQFNPLSNVGVFSNDASLLIPTTALSADTEGKVGADYLVMGWPQTIASTENPVTSFGSDLRAFLTIVGTADETDVRVELSTKIIGDGDTIPAKEAGDLLEVKLNAYDVLNLETGGFGPDADFTGSRVSSSRPVVVFSGSEASDVPDPPDLTFRRCCADHLEQQLFPVTTLGRTFIALTTPSRTGAVSEAGARITKLAEEQEYFRVLTTGEFPDIITNLEPPYDKLSPGQGGIASIQAARDFTIQATSPVVVGQFVAGQQEVGIPSDLPGGDPSFILLPPVEQYRKEYLFLTPDKYSFDFLLVAAPKDTFVRLDGRELKEGCDEETGQKVCCTHTVVGSVQLPGQGLETEFEAYKCQLSFPEIVPDRIPPENLLPGLQYDGVHRLTATQPVGLVVYGFDAFVSYGYPGGTDLALINVN